MTADWPRLLGAFLGGGALAAAGLYLATSRSPAVPAPAPANPVFAAGVREVVPTPASTDAGWPVRLLEEILAPPPTWTLEQERRRLEEMGLGAQYIQAAPLSAKCDCYGWVFTGGRYALFDTADVLRIMEDNGYGPVPDGRPGDLVLYTDHAGRPIHVGVVVGRAAEGPVLVESKWGLGGLLCIHPLDEHPYGQRAFTYLRSRRHGHLLRGLPDADPAKPEARKDKGTGPLR